VLGDEDEVRRAEAGDSARRDSLGVRPDTARPRVDTARGDTTRPARRPLGDPVRRDTIRRPPPDTSGAGGGPGSAAAAGRW
jgi:hypothetical protein